MAIYLYYGKVGDGKSFHVVKTEILPAVRDGRKMYCYMDGLNPRRLSQFAGRNSNVVMWDSVGEVRAACQLEVDDRDGVGLKVDRGSLVVVDEAQLVWDAREWQKTGKQAMAFFEYHRHFGLDIVIITQSPGRLDKGVVRLANECLHVKNLRFLSSALGSRYVVNIRQAPQDREPIASIRGRFDSNVFACYRSATVVRGPKVSARGIRGPMVWGPALAAVALILYMRSGGLGILKGSAPPVAVVDSGRVPSPESYPKPTGELRALDPPVVRVEGRPSVETAAVAAATPKEQEKEQPRIVGLVEVNGVRQIIRAGSWLVDTAQVETAAEAASGKGAEARQAVLGGGSRKE